MKPSTILTIADDKGCYFAPKKPGYKSDLLRARTLAWKGYLAKGGKTKYGQTVFYPTKSTKEGIEFYESFDA